MLHEISLIVIELTVDSSHIAFQGRSINGIEDVPKVSNDKEVSIHAYYLFSFLFFPYFGSLHFYMLSSSFMMC